MTSHDEIIALHDVRHRGLDPLLPRAAALAGDDLIVVDDGVAQPVRYRPDPQALDATWSAADGFHLRARVTGPAALDALLSAWAVRVRESATPDDPDSAAVVSWPSRDVAATAVFLRHGMSAGGVVAVRTPRPHAPVPLSDHLVRVAGPGDLDDAVALQLTEVRWDEQFGTMAERPSTAGAMRRDYAEALAREPSWTWIAPVGGTAAGMLRVTPPEHAGWIAPNVDRSPAAYLSCLAVAAGRRGSGIGSALVAAAHRALDAAGVAATLLHYAALNPLSGPFWHRHGYRPLWTTWLAKPASYLR